MRDLSKALENIRKAMHEQDARFREEAGLGPKKPKPEPKIPSLKPEPAPQTLAEGYRDPNRFLLETAPDIEPAPVPEMHSEPQTQDTAPEIVEVIPQKDSRHSWLYNEVAKAVQNASDGNPNTKVVAVFVPVVQSGHEFKDMPVHETVELSPVHEEDFNAEDEIDIQDDPVTNEQEPVETEEPSISEPAPSEPEEPVFINEEPQEPETLSLTDAEPQEPQEPEIPEELSAEAEQAEHLGELIPESMEHPDPELAEAFNTMEEKLDESIAAANELPEVDMSEFDITEDEDYSEGEKMSFTEIPPADDVSETLPELDLPNELEDDEIIDDIDESSEDSKKL